MPNLYAPEPDASIQNHELDNDEPDEFEEEGAANNEEYQNSFLSNALSDTSITIPRGGSVSGGSRKSLENHWIGRVSPDLNIFGSRFLGIFTSRALDAPNLTNI